MVGGSFLSLPVESVAFLLENLKTAHFLCGHVAPGNVEVGCAELQLQDPFEQPPGNGMRPGMVEVVEPAMRAAIDRELERPAMRAGAGRVGVIHRALEPATPAPHVVRVRAAARPILLPITKLCRANGPIDQQPERGRVRPLVRPYEFGSKAGSRSSMAFTSSMTAADLWFGGISSSL